MADTPPDPAEPLVRTLFEALNRPDLEMVVALYAPDAQITFPSQDIVLNKAPRKKTATRSLTLTRPEAIHDYYEWLLSDKRRGTEFELDSVTTTGETTVAAWHIESQDMGRLEEGQEAFTLREGHIVQHATAFGAPLTDVSRSNVDEEPDDEADTPAQNAVDADPPAEPVPAAAPAIEWPAGKCLVGMGVAEDGLRRAAGQPGNVQTLGNTALFVGRVEAVKLPLTARPEDVAALRQSRSDVFILVTVNDLVAESGETPAGFVSAVTPRMGPLYQAGVRYFKIDPQSVATFNVWRALFGSIQALAQWFIEVQTLLKARFPEARLGFTVIRPPYDPAWAADTARFLSEIDPAVQAADWVAVPCLWTNPDERESPDHGRLYRRYRERYPDKLLFITEFGSQGVGLEAGVDPQEYLEYYRSLRPEPNVGAAFADVLLGTATPTAWWAYADGTPGALGNVVGARRWGEPGDLKENFAGFATNDRPEGKDELNYDDYARAFVRVLSNPDTKTPLTIGIYGSWGMGKSFLMKRIRALVDESQQAHEHGRRAQAARAGLGARLHRLRPVRPFRPETPKLEAGGKPVPVPWRRRLAGWLERVFTRAPSLAVDFHCVEFNAWVYSGSENLWAGLITHLYDEVEKFLGTRRTVPFRFSQNARRALKKTLGLLALYGLLLLGFALSVLLDIGEIRATLAALGAGLATFRQALALGGTLAAILAALAALPTLINALRDVGKSLTLKRSEQLAALASRRDFRDKIGFMADIKDEIRMIRQLLDAGRDGVRTRLVIFIDDLDRCEPKKAIEVLEAIMLLLADEDGMPFVVVLGIDARIVVKAVEERYGKVLTEAGISGYEYLDKIVQIPFRIPPPPSAALAQYVTSLLWRSPEEREAAEAKEAEAAKARSEFAAAAKKIAEQLAAAAVQPAGATDGGPPARPTEPPDPVQPSGPDDPPAGARAPRQIDFAALARMPQRMQPPPEVTFLPDEREAFEAYARADHLGPNPRRVKRILNIYRIVRLLNPDTTAAQRQQMIKWVVLTEQWPYRTAWLMQAAEDDGQRPPAQRQLNDSDGLSTVYTEVLPDIRAKEAQPFAGLDADPDLFDSFIAAAPAITVADLRRLRPYTFNLNPALQGEVTKAVARKGTAQEERPQTTALRDGRQTVKASL